MERKEGTERLEWLGGWTVKNIKSALSYMYTYMYMNQYLLNHDTPLPYPIISSPPSFPAKTSKPLHSPKDVDITAPLPIGQSPQHGPISG